MATCLCLLLRCVELFSNISLTKNIFLNLSQKLHIQHLNFKTNFHPDKLRPTHRGGDSNAVAIFGAFPPNRESYEDLCGPPTTCPDCPESREYKCKETLLTLYDLVGNLEIKQAENRSYAHLPNRTFGENLFLFLIRYFYVSMFQKLYFFFFY